MAVQDLTSAYFLNARSLSAACTFANSDVAIRRATLELSLVRLPQHWGYCVCCGVAEFVQALERINPSAAEIDAALELGCINPELAHQIATSPCCVDANLAPEGALLFCGDPIATIEGPLWQAWIVADLARSILLPSCVSATRGSRLVLAAKGTPIVDGSSCLEPDRLRTLSVARAAHVGGVAFTQSPIAAARLGIQLRASPPADALVLSGPVEYSRASGWSFAYATNEVLMPLGPGDDEEETLAEIHRMGLMSSGWVSRGLGHTAVGLETRVSLVALEQGGAWTPRLGAVTDFSANPGRTIVIRYLNEAGAPIGDVIHGVGERIQSPAEAVLVGHMRSAVAVPIAGAKTAVPLHVSVLRSGARSWADEDLPISRDRARLALLGLHESYKRLRHPAVFPVGIAPALAQFKASLIAKIC
jgi:hypothetical protein